MRRILHIDMDAFFASVEQLRHPELAGKPVVVGGGGDPTKRGVVSTASYEARKFGVRSAMPLVTAHRLCPDAVFLSVDYREYARVSRMIKDILAGYSNTIEDVGIDEAFLDVSASSVGPEEVARRIKAEIRDRLSLTCSIGIAPNKLLAKIASDIDKPDGLTVIKEEDVERVLSPLPVRKLWGVGPKTEERLKMKGVNTVGELRAVSVETLVGWFGRSFGGYLHEASRGLDESPLVTHWERKSVSREETFEHDIGKWQEIARNLATLTRDVVEDMVGMGLHGRTVTVKIRFADFTTLTRSRTLEEPSGSLDALRGAAFECLGRVDLKGKLVRLIGVRVSGLSDLDRDRQL